MRFRRMPKPNLIITVHTILRQFNIKYYESVPKRWLTSTFMKIYKLFDILRLVVDTTSQCSKSSGAYLCETEVNRRNVSSQRYRRLPSSRVRRTIAWKLLIVVTGFQVPRVNSLLVHSYDCLLRRLRSYEMRKCFFDVRQKYTNVYVALSGHDVFKPIRRLLLASAWIFTKDKVI